MTKQVAETILQQLGGNKFIVMTGAKNFLSHSIPQPALSFHVSSTSTKNKCNYVKITLNTNDLYIVEFSKIVKYTLKGISNHIDIGAENLTKLFETETGLYTKLF